MGPPSCRRELIDSSIAADVRIDFKSIRACPRTNAMSRALLFETPAVPRYIAYPAFVLLRPRCWVGGIIVDQQAHAARSRGFRRGSTWRVIHRVAGITLARWLQLVVAGPRGPTCRPSPSFMSPSFPPRPPFCSWLIPVCIEMHLWINISIFAK